MSTLSGLTALLSNQLPALSENAGLVGIIGDHPSAYAKSPLIWNPTFDALGINAMYLPFDVPAGHLRQVIGALRDIPTYLGGNVTVPYKIDVMAYLDRLDPLAEAIGAVNTIVRDEQGALIGYNTDGQGAIDTLTRLQPGKATPFVESLDGQRVLLIGAGGAARAVSFYLGRHIGTGRMWIANRTDERSDELAGRLRMNGTSAAAITFDDFGSVIGEVTLLLNTTSIGQSGLRSLRGGQQTILEPYSPLAAFSVEAIATENPGGIRAWAASMFDDIVNNNRRSWELLTRLPVTARCFDVIYSPLETVLLQQARLSGHATAAFLDDLNQTFEFAPRQACVDGQVDRLVNVIHALTCRAGMLMI